MSSLPLLLTRSWRGPAVVLGVDDPTGEWVRMAFALDRCDRESLGRAAPVVEPELDVSSRRRSAMPFEPTTAAVMIPSLP